MTHGRLAALRLLSFLAMVVVLYGLLAAECAVVDALGSDGGPGATCSTSSFWLFEGLLAVAFVGPAIASLAIGRELLARTTVARPTVRSLLPTVALIAIVPFAMVSLARVGCI